MERLPDCPALSALIKESVGWHISPARFLECCDAHSAACSTCAAIKASDALIDADPEPECSCHQTDVDMFDARGCELHDSLSGWNSRQNLKLITEEAA